MPGTLNRAWPLAALAAICLLAWVAYSPGLHGGFLFDDYVNLDALGKFGVVDNWPVFWRYVTSGTADPLGRPLALATFLLDARNWPAEPASFIRSNLLIHLANGALLYFLLRRLQAAAGGRGGTEPVALIGAALWLLHPLLVSTTPYVVQREAMLPATFVMLGLLAWIHGRERFVASEGRGGRAWMMGGIVGGTVLAAACKANGVLLPTLAWVLEATVLAASVPQQAHAARRLRQLRLLLLVLPSVLLFVYLLLPLGHLHEPLAVRPWTIGQRLLSEPRAIVHYLYLLVVPQSGSTGLFNDHFRASTSLLDPWTTLPALLAVAGLVALAFATRRRAPALAAALLFFLAGHLLESTSLPLELYFEHRNYLPALLLPWPLARAIAGWSKPASVRVAVAVALCLLLAATTWQRASTWGNPDALAELWAKQNPDSSRAQAMASIQQTRRGDPARAAARLTAQLRERPGDAQLALNLVDARCAAGALGAGDKAIVARALRSTPPGALGVAVWLDQAISAAASGDCPGLALIDAKAWIDSAQAGALRGGSVRDLQPLLAHLALAQNQPDVALQHYDTSLLAAVNPGVAARQAAELANEGYYEQALAHLDTYARNQERQPPPPAGMPRVHARVLEWQGYWPNELAVLRSRLHAAIRDRDAGVAK